MTMVVYETARQYRRFCRIDARNPLRVRVITNHPLSVCSRQPWHLNCSSPWELLALQDGNRLKASAQDCPMKLCDYDVGNYFDEMFGETGRPRAAARPLARNIESLPNGELSNRQSAADRALVQAGITFNVYGESAGLEKTLPFDLVPRMVTATEWERIEKGLKQR